MTSVDMKVHFLRWLVKKYLFVDFVSYMLEEFKLLSDSINEVCSVSCDPFVQNSGIKLTAKGCVMVSLIETEQESEAK